VCLGMAYYLNAMQANFVLGILVLVWAAEPGPLATRLRRVAVGGLTVLLVSLPTWVWLAAIARQPAPPGAMSSKAIADFAKFYYPDHYFWSVKTLPEKTAGAILPVVVMILVVALARAPGHDPDRKTRPQLVTAGVLIGYVALGAIAASRWPSRFVLELHLFRSDVIGFALAVAMAGAIVVRGLQASESGTTLAGADCATIPPAIFRALYQHDLTDKGLAAFLKDWRASGQKIL